MDNLRSSLPSEEIAVSQGTEKGTETGTETALALAQADLKWIFKNRSLLVQALTHSSFSNESESATGPVKDNERLEFLGDAVIGLVVATDLMNRFPEATEGKLSRWRSQLVSRKALAELAWEMGMGNWVLLGKGERRTGGAEKRSILAGVFEAVIGALYIDAGIEVASAYLLRSYEPLIQGLTPLAVDHRKMLDVKTFLQEKTQSLHKCAPIYRVVDTWGLEHEKYFRVSVELQGKVIAEGEGRSKKEAESQAASRALEHLGLVENR